MAGVRLSVVGSKLFGLHARSRANSVEFFIRLSPGIRPRFSVHDGKLRGGWLCLHVAGPLCRQHQSCADLGGLDMLETLYRAVWRQL